MPGATSKTNKKSKAKCIGKYTSKSDNITDILKTPMKTEHREHNIVSPQDVNKHDKNIDFYETNERKNYESQNKCAMKNNRNEGMLMKNESCIYYSIIQTTEA